jgi:heavy metal translocating P-type ATPase
VTRLLRFFRHYKLFSAALSALVAGLVLFAFNDKTIAYWLIGVVSILEALPLLWQMYKDVQLGSYGIDILAITAIVASVLLKQYWAAIVVVLMLTGGESLEDYAEHRAQSELSSLLKNAPKSATVIRKGKQVKVGVNEINIGDKVLIKAGELVPVDAVIIEGQANFDESLLTGESLPQLKAVKALVLSGSINVDGPVTAKAVASAVESQYQQIVKLVQGASNSQAPFVRLADRYSVPFTLVAYAIATTVWILSGHAIRFLEVIIVATPCPLLLAAPVAFISGMSRSSHYGIIVKTGKSLERLARAKTIAFDKTGTLTKGELSVSSVSARPGYTSEQVISLAVSLEQNSNHVLAHAITNYATSKKIKPVKAKKIEEIAGLGLTADLKGSEVLVGGLGLLKDRGISLETLTGTGKSASNKTTAYIALDGKLIGFITFEDALRKETKNTIEALRNLGMKDIVMITGDNKAVADNIAKQLGISDVYSDALPADKLNVLNELRPKPVIFVGDGVNDAPALTSADVGIALGARGSTAASESADMVIMLDDLSRVAAGIEIAKQTFKIAKQSILIGIWISFILMIIFATGKLRPLTGALLQELVDVFVIFNALRAHVISPSMIDEH